MCVCVPIKMLLQGLHASFLIFQIFVAWEFLLKGIELRPEVAQKFGLSDENRVVYPYLTVWNLVVHITYLVVCAAEDILVAFTDEKSLTDFKKKFGKNRAFIFETLVFPGSLLVVSAYWILTLMDPLYLFPGPIEELIPAWINFLIHSGVGIFAVGELLFRREAWSPYHSQRRKRIGLIILVSYAIVILTHRYTSGSWIYPFIEYISWLQRIAIVLLFATITVIFYHLGYHLSIIFHGATRVRSKFS
ncbi:androgen-dependent TFPI-regulating protein-like [Hetaerina americana]|uniref:androgen-dependent TFPI-regulating protein-like n=1 Tax=Hetaerina americana TaxID=62018 RepID=UPI003A7F1FBD